MFMLLIVLFAQDTGILFILFLLKSKHQIKHVFLVSLLAQDTESHRYLFYIYQNPNIMFLVLSVAFALTAPGRGFGTEPLYLSHF